MVNKPLRNDNNDLKSLLSTAARYPCNKTMKSMQTNWNLTYAIPINHQLIYHIIHKKYQEANNKPLNSAIIKLFA